MSQNTVHHFKLPTHLGIIMDGNGRWAQNKGRQRLFGHIKGARVARQTVTDCARLGIQNLTLFAFSSENWFRPQEEVSFLMYLLERYIRREKENLKKENVRFSTIGDLSKVPKDLVSLINQTRKETESNTGMNLVFAMSYGSRHEITNAAKMLAQKALAGEISVDSIDEVKFGFFLDSYPLPDLDLIIRTSGESRLSNFMLWQAAYAELCFTDVLWPDFDKTELMKGLTWFSERKRRFGKINEQLDEQISSNASQAGPKILTSSESKHIHAGLAGPSSFNP